LVPSTAEGEGALPCEDDDTDGGIISGIREAEAEFLDGSWCEGISSFWAIDCDLMWGTWTVEKGRSVLLLL